MGEAGRRVERRECDEAEAKATSSKKEVREKRAVAWYENGEMIESLA